MTRLRLYVDEDSHSKELLRALRARGLDVVAAREIEMMARPDEDQLRWATHDGRVIYSYNASDFCRLHTNFLLHGEDHAGIIVAPQQRFSVGDQMRLVLKLAAARSAGEMRNQLEFLANWR